MRHSHFGLLLGLLLLAPTVRAETVVTPQVRLHRALADVDVPYIPMPDELESFGSSGPRRPPADDSAADLDAWARLEAERLAERLADRSLSEASEIGFWSGLRRALDDPWLGDVDRRFGFDQGLEDPEARRLGWEEGSGAAEASASAAATGLMADLFRDLQWEPRPPRSAPPTPASPPTSLRVGEPSWSWSGRSTGFRGRRDLGSLARCHSWKDLWDGSWSDWSRALSRWEKGLDSSSPWHDLDADHKGRFRVVFEHAFYRRAEKLRSRGLAADLRRAFREGARDGWREGVEARAEQEYLHGYRDGFETALREASERAWEQIWRDVWLRTANAEFDHWSSRPHPEILAVRVVDGDDDGVVSPGETVHVALEVANLGGVDGWFPVEIRSDVLAGSIRDRLEVPRRSVGRSVRPLEARIRPETPPRTTSSLVVDIGEAHRAIPLRVAHPLEISRPVRLVVRDVLEGAVEVPVQVRNNSRREVAGRVFLEAVSAADEERVSPYAAGAERSLVLARRGLDPLDLLEGRAALRVVVVDVDGLLHDTETVHTERSVSRLGDVGLWEVVFACTEGPRGPRAERLHRLVTERLRLDWERAIAASGNPYRRDRDAASRPETELGEMVRRARSTSCGSLDRRELAERIEGLAADLPGVHPLLRRHFRLLAREMGQL